MSRLKEGMRVVKVFHGITGYIERTPGTVGLIENGVVYFLPDEDGGSGIEEGITYTVNGRERENFFPPIYCTLEQEDE